MYAASHSSMKHSNGDHNLVLLISTKIYFISISKLKRKHVMFWNM